MGVERKTMLSPATTTRKKRKISPEESRKNQGAQPPVRKKRRIQEVGGRIRTDNKIYLPTFNKAQRRTKELPTLQEICMIGLRKNYKLIGHCYGIRFEQKTLLEIFADATPEE